MGIDPQIVSHVLSRGSATKVGVYNVGRGGDTPALEYLWLERLIRKNPDALRDSLVLIEAPDGLPIKNTWKDPWVSIVPQRLSEFLDTRDLPLFWKSEQALKTKIYVSLSHFFRVGVAIPNWQSRISVATERWVTDGLITLIRKIEPGTPVENYDEIQQTRDRARVLFRVPHIERSTQYQRPFVQWEQMIVRKMVELVQQQGGNCSFFHMPMSTFLGRKDKTPLRIAERKVFEKKLSQWGSGLITTPLRYDDFDFPDLIHLGKRRSLEFSKLLGEAIRAAYPVRIGTLAERTR